MPETEVTYDSGPYYVHTADDSMSAVVWNSYSLMVVARYRGETSTDDAIRWVDDNYNPHL